VSTAVLGAASATGVSCRGALHTVFAQEWMACGGGGEGTLGSPGESLRRGCSRRAGGGVTAR
jgi:hypothetical protein